MNSDRLRGLNQSGQLWFEVRLIYSTSVASGGRRVSIEDDRWLLQASSARDAFEQATSGAYDAVARL